MFLGFTGSQFHGLNELTEKYSLGEHVNREVSDLFSKRILSIFRGSLPV
jgi:hypothetical protein